MYIMTKDGWKRIGGPFVWKEQSTQEVSSEEMDRASRLEEARAYMD